MKILVAASLALTTSLALAGEVSPVAIQAPTLSEIGLIVLAVAVGIAGGIFVRRKK
jgi:hypothetical protein